MADDITQVEETLPVEVPTSKMDWDTFFKWAFGQIAIASAFGDEMRARNTLEKIIEQVLENEVFGAKKELKCLKHPGKELKGKPKNECEECMAIWVLKTSQNITH